MKIIDYSIIIPVSRSEYIVSCVDSLDKAASKSSDAIELILVGEKVEHQTQYIKYYRNITEKRTHTSVRRNVGIKNAKGELLVFLDDDTKVDVDFFNRLSVLKDSGHLIFTGPTSLYTKEQTEMITDILLSDYIGELRTAEKTKRDSETFFYNVYLSNVMIRRCVFERIGIFNEKIDYRMDDTEFFHRAQMYGIRPFYTERMRVIHKRRNFGKDFIRHIFISRFYTGINTVSYPVIMTSIPGIRIILTLMTFLIFLFFRLSLTRLIKAFFIAALLYIMTVFGITVNKREIKNRYRLLMPAIFVTHMSVIWGFILGIITGIINRVEYELK